MKKFEYESPNPEEIPSTPRKKPVYREETEVPPPTPHRLKFKYTVVEKPKGSWLGGAMMAGWMAIVVFLFYLGYSKKIGDLSAEALVEQQNCRVDFEKNKYMLAKIQVPAGAQGDPGFLRGEDQVHAGRHRFTDRGQNPNHLHCGRGGEGLRRGGRPVRVHRWTADGAGPHPPPPCQRSAQIIFIILPLIHVLSTLLLESCALPIKFISCLATLWSPLWTRNTNTAALRNTRISSISWSLTSPPSAPKCASSSPSTYVQSKACRSSPTRVPHSPCRIHFPDLRDHRHPRNPLRRKPITSN